MCAESDAVLGDNGFLRAENARLKARLADVTAELDNVLPSKQALARSLSQVLDECFHYKAQADEFELKASELEASVEGLGAENARLESLLAAARDGRDTANARGTL